jgi:acetyl esterase/lipase
MNFNRRKFLKNSTMIMGAVGLSQSAVGGPFKNPEDPDPALEDEEIFLWADGSENNGQNPEYRPKIKIYYPTVRDKDANKKFAAVLICPGGGYHIQASHEGQPFARLFAMNGIIGIVLTYRVSPDRYPGSYSDACRAIRYLRKNANNYNIDPDRIGIMGFSAGGHLASTVATQPDLYKDKHDDLAESVSARPNRLILGYPVISFIDDYAHTGSANALLGDEPDQEMARQLSNNHQVTGDNPPAFLFHTAEDKGVPPQNSLSFAEACIEHNVPVELHMYETGKHGVGMALDNPSLNTWSDLMINWLSAWK